MSEEVKAMDETVERRAPVPAQSAIEEIAEKQEGEQGEKHQEMQGLDEVKDVAENVVEQKEAVKKAEPNTSSTSKEQLKLDGQVAQINVVEGHLEERRETEASTKLNLTKEKDKSAELAEETEDKLLEEPNESAKSDDVAKMNAEVVEFNVEMQKDTVEIIEKELKASKNTNEAEAMEKEDAAPKNTEDIEKNLNEFEKPEPEEAFDDIIDSQDSVDLVIDEKSNEQEMPEDDKSQESAAAMDVQEDNSKEAVEKAEIETKADDERDEKESCEDTSEVSVMTQIDAAELDSVDDHKMNASKTDESKVVEDDDVLIMEDPSASQVIEIDDEPDDEEEQRKTSAPLNDTKESNTTKVATSATAKEAEKESTQKQEQIITVIEIDDEDDEDEAPVSSGQQETKNETLGETSATPMDLDCSDDVEKPGEEVIPSTVREIEKLYEGESKNTETIVESLLEAVFFTAQKPDAPAGTWRTAEAVADSNRGEVNDDADDIEDEDPEVFYAKECINYECPRDHKQFFRAPQFSLSYFKVAKKKFKQQFICSTCYDTALNMYEQFSGLLLAKQPLLLKDIIGGRQEFVEIIDSSDEEDSNDKTDKEKDRVCFTAEDRNLIEAELENSIKRVLDKVEIQSQLTWSKTLLAARARNLEEENRFIDEELRQLQRKADNMHESLYQCPKIKIRQLQPLDLNSGRPYSTEMPQLPPVGEIIRPPIQIYDVYFAVKNKAIASWVPCKVGEQVDNSMGMQKNLKHYKIKFLKSQYQMLKTVSVKHLAYYNPPPVRLPIGTRVIAYFDATSLSRGKEKMMIQSAFYPGIIAEPLKPNNKYRYLIFYDDGYTQYVYHKDVRLVCHVSENVWEDVHPASRDFIQKYLTQYSINRPMVQTQKGQSMTTESNGKWIYARVVDIDCSLIQMQFEGTKSHTEWIYRGSMRLGPVFKEYQKTLQKDSGLPILRLPRRTEPFIRYTEDEETTSSNQQKYWNCAETTRAVAKKSVSQRQQDTSATIVAASTMTRTPAPSTSSSAAAIAAAASAAAAAAAQTVRHLNNSTIYLEDENKPKGKVVFYTAKRNLPPKTFVQHQCAPDCLYKITHNLSAYSPLSKPLLSGWERLIIRQKIKKLVTYRAPCGRIQRNMKELRQYLRDTQNTLNVDNFDFNHETNCLAEYVIESTIVQKRDISGGQEKMAIPLVNYYDSTLPPECKYAAQRIPTEGVNLELSEEFLVGCDCDDDCSDKSKCSCWQLTYAGAKYGNPNTPMEEIGYQYKRLYEHVPTGIYECNSRCKCKSNCLNRVVQHSLQMKLQVFKTSNRGWGLRCLNDVPRGSFICIYAGHLLTEAKANEGGLDAGDEYFAELDYIEVAEQIKEGYESEAEPVEQEDDEEAYVPDQDEDEEFMPQKYVSRKNKPQRLTRGTSSHNTEEDSQERQVINFNPNADMNENSERECSIRQLFGRDEACYVMDAKTIGNLGRYFNHSCAPNLFVQNVFVDTHDLRFPWVAFFALTHIRAGTELTWNYNYEVGVVPGKVLYCQCGAPTCRLRLL